MRQRDEVRAQKARVGFDVAALRSEAEARRGEAEVVAEECQALTAMHERLVAAAGNDWAKAALLQQALRQQQASIRLLAVARAAAAMPACGTSTSSSSQLGPRVAVTEFGCWPLLGRAAAEDGAALRSRLDALQALGEAMEAERLQLQVDCKEHVQLCAALREAHQTLSDKLDATRCSLRQVRCEVITLHKQRNVAKTRLDEGQRDKSELSRLHARCRESTSSNRTFIEVLQGETWKELRETKKVFDTTIEDQRFTDKIYHDHVRQVALCATARRFPGSLQSTGASVLVPRGPRDALTACAATAPPPPKPHPEESGLPWLSEASGRSPRAAMPLSGSRSSGAPAMCPGVAAAKPQTPMRRPAGTAEVEEWQHHSQSPQSARGLRALDILRGGQLVMAGSSGT